MYIYQYSSTVFSFYYTLTDVQILNLFFFLFICFNKGVTFKTEDMLLEKLSRSFYNLKSQRGCDH